MKLIAISTAGTLIRLCRGQCSASRFDMPLFQTSTRRPGQVTNRCRISRLIFLHSSARLSPWPTKIVSPLIRPSEAGNLAFGVYGTSSTTSWNTSTEGEILKDFPDLTREDIRACLEFAAERERKLVSLPPQ